MTQHLVKKQPDLYQVVGDLTFDTVAGYEKEGFVVMDSVGKSLTIDFSGVTKVSSAALALLLSWMRHARKEGIDLKFGGFSERFQAILNISDLADVIPLSS